MRYYLKPQDTASKDRLMELTGAKGVAPLDSFLGVAGLPFKITPEAMLRIAYWAQNQLSYQRAEEAIYEIMHVRVNDDTVRMVSDYVGRAVFEHDCAKANEAYRMLNEGKLSFLKNRRGVLYLLTDGAAVNTRLQDDAGSTWRENKLGEVFSSQDIYSWTDKKGQRQHKLQRREYVSYLGPAAEFKKHLLYCALCGGYGQFEETVVLSCGCSMWAETPNKYWITFIYVRTYTHMPRLCSIWTRQNICLGQKEFVIRLGQAGTSISCRSWNRQRTLIQVAVASTYMDTSQTTRET